MSTYFSWSITVHGSTWQYIIAVHDGICSAYTSHGTYWYILISTCTSEYKLHVCRASNFAAQHAWKAMDWQPGSVQADAQMHAQTDLFMKLEIIAAVAVATSGKAACSCSRTIAAAAVAASWKATWCCGWGGDFCRTLPEDRTTIFWSALS